MASAPAVDQQLWRLYMHSSESMSEVESGIVKMVMTSPNRDEILNSHMLDEIYRVMRDDDGVFVLNIGAPMVNWETSTEDVLRPYRMAKDIVAMSDRKLMLRRDFIIGYHLANPTDSMIWMSSEDRHGFICTHQHLFVFSKANAHMRPVGPVNAVRPTACLITGGMDKGVVASRTPGAMPTPFESITVGMMLEVFSLPGDRILDPLAGNGTLGVAAIGMGRRCILYELVPGYEETIRQNLERAVKEWNKKEGITTTTVATAVKGSEINNK